MNTILFIKFKIKQASKNYFEVPFFRKLAKNGHKKLLAFLFAVMYS